ncbi:methyl-accepting chemotaxis protein [Halopseudomonas salegens]|uniref:Methyl-accepting chemotaxis protein n=1 Tax=Halopseudomonas salegens TaxID=1434072 RepID=A0A1H2ELW0_9GAMM|nr:methyl-accepting chemotaxis protein [Halopseudomonas salegens]SDT96090.1 methyl-accepting chemotaxis protein [Halopseudomonas salegens]
MNAFMAPAIALMNRLSYGMKFCLISLLFLVPLIIVSSMLVQQSYQRVVISEHALDSLALVRQQVEIVRRAEQLRDLDTAYFQMTEGQVAEQLEQRTAALRQDLIERLNALPVRAEADGASDLLELRDTLVDLYQRIGQESTRGRADMSAQAYGQAISLLGMGASYAGLMQDYDADVRQVGNILVNAIPEVTSTLGHGRAVGSYVVELGYMNSDASRIMDDILDVLPRVRNDYQQALGFLDGREEFASLRNEVTRSIESLDATQQIFEDDIILASTMTGSWNEFFDRITTQVDTSWNLGDATLVALESVLDARVGSNYQAMFTLIILLGLVLVVVVYLYGGFYLATRHTIKHLSEKMGQVAQGDMTVQARVDSRDELGALASDFNDTILRIRELIQQVSSMSAQVNEQSDQVQQISADSSQAVAAQRSQIEQVATAMNEMAATSQEVASSAAVAVSNAEEVNNETLNGRTLVESSVKVIEGLANEIEHAVKVINKLADDSSSISRVLDVIKGVAEQTNLLALNAAIEAARAGEQGRGFAVVADEVRTLARRTHESTEEIEQMIARLQEGVNAAVKAMGSSHGMTGESVDSTLKVQAALANILTSISQIVDQSQQIAAAAEEQTAVSHDIDQNIVQINEVGERTAVGARQAEESSHRMGQLVQELQRIVSAFRV